MIFSRLGIFPCWRSKLVGTGAILQANSTYTSCLHQYYPCCYCTWSWSWPNLIITILIFKLQSTNVSNASNDQVSMMTTLFITEVELILQLCEGVQAMIWSDDIEKSTPRKTTYSTTYSQKRRIRWRRYVFSDDHYNPTCTWPVKNCDLIHKRWLYITCICTRPVINSI